MRKDLTLYFDVDGVKARFTDGVCALHGRPVKQPTVWDMHNEWDPPMDDTAFYAPQDRAFWASLGVWEDGMALFRFVESLVGQDRMCLMTSPVQTEGCSEGKRDWVKKHLPHYLPDLVIGGCKHKMAGPNKVLIDDSDSNVSKFQAHGGHGWLVPRPWNSARGLVDSSGMFNVLAESKALQKYLESL